MKVSYQWLREWVAPKLDPEALAARLTLGGIEVGAIEPVAPTLDGVVVGEVLLVEPHPSAGRLHCCRVRVAARETLEIVCGASNVAAGMRVPVARVGAALPGGKEIREAEIQGVRSQGMLCSAAELGLAESSDGLLDIGSSAPVGKPLAAALALDDVTLEVELTPNRGDCLSVAGLAREIAALTGAALRVPKVPAARAAAAGRVNVVVEAPQDCPHYAGRVLEGINASAVTPLWMRERLRRSGIRAIHPVVDVTNYVMLELGQPMHAFDLATLQGSVRVRHARAGEALVMLDGRPLALPAGSLVIADGARALALAGIMGGEASGVTAATRAIFLESAYFAPEAIAGRARSLGLHTESSHRFERGVDAVLQRRALERATQLLMDIVGGKPGPVIEKRSARHLPRSTAVRLRAARLSRVLGAEIPRPDVETSLRRLGMKLARDKQGWRAVPPSYRFDIAREEDLIEEVARVRGYDRLPKRLPVIGMPVMTVPEARLPPARLRSLLVDRDYREVITYSFVDPVLNQLLDPQREPLALANPISADMAVMRTSLLPGLVKTLLHNLNRQQNRVRVFEIGRCFIPEAGGTSQDRYLAGLVTGSALAEQWGSATRATDFYDLKADIEALFALGGRSGLVEFIAGGHSVLHPGRSARIDVGGRAVGFVGGLHPQVRSNLGIDPEVFVFEIQLKAISEAIAPIFSEISRFPSIRRDLALVIDESAKAAEVMATIRKVAGKLLVNLELFDEYRGKGIDSGRKSLAVGLTLQDSSRTLTEGEVEAVVARVVSTLQTEFGAQLRH